MMTDQAWHHPAPHVSKVGYYLPLYSLLQLLLADLHLLYLWSSLLVWSLVYWDKNTLKCQSYNKPRMCDWLGRKSGCRIRGKEDMAFIVFFVVLLGKQLQLFGKHVCTLTWFSRWKTIRRSCKMNQFSSHTLVK